MITRFLWLEIFTMIGISAIFGCHAALASTGSSGQTNSTPKANADVLFVRAVLSGENTWTFHVTVSHPDTGWQNYADGWDVLTLKGKVLKTRSSIKYTRDLAHPHVDEQPFTRSAGGIVIPSGVTKVRVRAHDSVDGFGGTEVLVDLSVASGPNFKVER